MIEAKGPLLTPEGFDFFGDLGLLFSDKMAVDAGGASVYGFGVKTSSVCVCDLRMANCQMRNFSFRFGF